MLLRFLSMIPTNNKGGSMPTLGGQVLDVLGKQRPISDRIAAAARSFQQPPVEEDSSFVDAEGRNLNFCLIIILTE